MNVVGGIVFDEMRLSSAPLSGRRGRRDRNQLGTVLWATEALGVLMIATRWKATNPVFIKM